MEFGLGCPGVPSRLRRSKWHRLDMRRNPPVPSALPRLLAGKSPLNISFLVVNGWLEIGHGLHSLYKKVAILIQWKLPMSNRKINFRNETSSWHFWENGFDTRLREFFGLIFIIYIYFILINCLFDFPFKSNSPIRAAQISDLASCFNLIEVRSAVWAFFVFVVVAQWKFAISEYFLS